MKREIDVVGLYRDADGTTRAWFMRGIGYYASYSDVSLVSVYRLTGVMRDLQAAFVFRPDSYGLVGWVAERRL